MLRVVLLYALAGCGRIGFGLGGEGPPTDGTLGDGMPTTDGVAADAMPSMTGLEDTSSSAQDEAGFSIASAAAPHSSGSLIVVAVHWMGTTSPIANVTDSSGNLYLRTADAESPNGGTVELYFANGIFGNPANSVIVTFSGLATNRRILVHEYPAGVMDQTDESSGFGSNATTGMTSSAGGGSDTLVVVATFTAGTDVAFSPGPGFALGATAGGDSALEDRLVSAGTVTGAMSWTPAASYAMVMAVFAR